MSRHPHILFFMTDQQRWDSLGCVNSLVKTPHLDRLASQGIRYDQAVCQAPMCVPSRCSMMQGLYAFQTGVRNNGQSITRKADLRNTPFPEALRQQGYRTLGFGKTHWHGEWFQNEPESYGFDKIWQAGARNDNTMVADAICWEEDEPETFAAWREEQKTLPKGGENLEGYLGKRSALPGSAHREGWLTRRCLAELDHFAASDSRQPLCLYFSLDFPHAGLFVPPEFEDLYELEDIPERPLADWTKMWESHRPNAHIEGFHEAWSSRSSDEQRMCTLRYYAATSYADDCFGQVLAKLESLGLLDNSLIVFTSDHGEMLGDRDHRFSKYCLYEGSVRVPLILAGSEIPESLRSNLDHRPAELIDLYPTLTELAGAAPRPELPGRSLLGPPCRLGSFCEMHGAGGRMEPSQRAPALMWRTRDWKLILHQPGSLGDAPLRAEEITGELYDLQEDPHELRNRYVDPGCRDIREKLALQLLMHQAQAGARWPRPASLRGIPVNPPEEIGAPCPRFGVNYWY